MADQWVARRDLPAVGAALGWTGGTLRRWNATVNGAAAGLWVDLGLYALSAIFAGFTVNSSLAPHREWGRIAVGSYAVAAAAVVVQLVWWSVHRRPPLRSRAIIAVVAAVLTALLPLIIEAAQRAAGHPGTAQDEVIAIEAGGQRMLHTGTPYLDHAAIAAQPVADRLLSYLPYQPGMAVFGLPRALQPGWYTDARLSFAVVTVAALAMALLLLYQAGIERAALVRALQAATVLPICALTLATGGDDLPVLALCLLALALAATDRLAGCGLAVGLAASLKLFAWPVLLILGVHALTQRRLVRFAVPALALPIATGVPAAVLNPGAAVENVIAFPFGKGLVTSPAASPLPGRLIATDLPAGHLIADVLLLAAAAWIMIRLVRHPPRTASAAARLCGWALLAATVLLPSTRFGYLLYPIAFFVWSPALRARPVPAPRLAPV
jgi:hypothetical protein